MGNDNASLTGKSKVSRRTSVMQRCSHAGKPFPLTNVNTRTLFHHGSREQLNRKVIGKLPGSGTLGDLFSLLNLNPD